MINLIIPQKINVLIILFIMLKFNIISLKAQDKYSWQIGLNVAKNTRYKDLEQNNIIYPEYHLLIKQINKNYAYKYGIDIDFRKLNDFAGNIISPSFLNISGLFGYEKRYTIEKNFNSILGWQTSVSYLKNPRLNSIYYRFIKGNNNDIPADVKIKVQNGNALNFMTGAFISIEYFLSKKISISTETSIQYIYQKEFSATGYSAFWYTADGNTKEVYSLPNNLFSSSTIKVRPFYFLNLNYILK